MATNPYQYNRQTFQFIATNAVSGIISHANVSIIRL